MPETPLLARHRAAGAHLAEEAGWLMPADFGDPASEHRACRESAILMDLSHRGKLRLAGEDAGRFLHGVLSNRVETLRPGEGVYTTFLTRHGKFVADLHLYRCETDLAADLAPGMARVFAEALDAYIIMDRVEVEDLTESRCAVGLFGPDAAARLRRGLGMDLPALPEHGHAEAGGIRVARELWTGEDGYLITAPAGRAGEIWEGLAGAGARPAGLAAFGTLSLEAGIPLFGKDMGPEVNPMQAGIEHRAIDFEKGCYIGQEVIAKIKYLGQVNRSLAGIRLEGKAVPPPGAQVRLGEKEVGSLTRAALGPTVGTVIAFSYLHRQAMEPGSRVAVRWNGNEAEGEVVALPFYRGAGA